MDTNIYSDYWQCPNCKTHYYSPHVMFGLVEKNRSELVAGIHEIGVLCAACSRVSSKDKRPQTCTLDSSLKPGVFPAEKVFLIELKCAIPTCNFSVPVLAATGSSLQKGDFERLQPSHWTISGKLLCRNGHPPQVPMKIVGESLLWPAS